MGEHISLDETGNPVLSGAAQITIILKEVMFAGNWEEAKRFMLSKTYRREEGRKEDLEIMAELRDFEEAQGIEFVLLRDGEVFEVTWASKEEVSKLDKEGIIQREHYVGVPQG